MSRVDDRKAMSEATRLTLLEIDMDDRVTENREILGKLDKLNTRITVMIVSFATAVLLLSLNLIQGTLGR